MNVYEKCPVLDGEHYQLRLVTKEDAADLFKVYSDKAAVPLFNSDNCHGDDFYYATQERMDRAMDFWNFSYEHGYFVRFAIVDKKTNEAVGTIELFHRDAADYFDDCGLLRLDLRSDHEKTKSIYDILHTLLSQAYELFDCTMIATKAVPQAKNRIKALQQLGFTETMERLVGQDGTTYGDYWVRQK